MSPQNLPLGLSLLFASALWFLFFAGLPLLGSVDHGSQFLGRLPVKVHSPAALGLTVPDTSRITTAHALR
jgi:hypothetical protein